MTLRAAHVLAFTLTLMALTAPALAQPARDEAKRLKDQGAAAYERGDYAVALDFFERAYRTFPSANLKFNLGIALGGIGRYGEAIDAFEQFLAEAKDAPPDARSYAADRLRELHSRVGTLTISVSPAGAELRLDGALIHPPPNGLITQPGPHKLSASRPGYATRTVEVSVTAGARTPAELTLVQSRAASPSEAPPSESPLPERPRKRTWIWITVGAVAVGAVAVGLGVGLGLKSRPPSSTLGAYSTGLP